MHALLELQFRTEVASHNSVLSIIVKNELCVCDDMVVFVAKCVVAANNNTDSNTLRVYTFDTETIHISYSTNRSQQQCVLLQIDFCLAHCMLIWLHLLALLTVVISNVHEVFEGI
jgi:hypothetical protein